MITKSLDTETSGIDLRHGAKPFFVTMCGKEGLQLFWEWNVDPLTRQPIIPDGDLAEIEEEIVNCDQLILQNCKFDTQALDTLPWKWEPWPWHKIRDTLLAGHLLGSNHQHYLDAMVLEYLHKDISKYESALEQAVKQAQQIVKHKYPEWRLAKKGNEEMPSAKEKTWKFDGWLPRAVAKAEKYPESHPWWNVLAAYGNTDSASTLALYLRQWELICERKLDKIYEERLKLLPIVYSMESRGITVNKQRLEELENEYREESARAGRVCSNIASSYGYELVIPKGGNNNSLRTFVFDVLKLPAIKTSKKTGEPALDKTVIEDYEATLPHDSKALAFIKSLKAMRKRNTALTYMGGYKRFWLPLGIFNDRGEQLWYRLHPSLNPTGTATLRWSSQNPNEQNISKQEGFNLRAVFGPSPGREWWSLDYQNIELRIPAYESNERVMIELFEKPDDPPYYGSYHLMNASIIYPDLFWPLAEQQGAFKKKYASTWYQWVKNFGFAVSYGAVVGSGTADRAAHKPGAQAMVMNRLKEHTKLNNRMINYAEEYGYVETIPDKEIDPERGYPVLCTRSNYGKILPTVPLNYHVQSSACWVMMRAMIKIHDYLNTLDGYYMVMNVHDEVVLDFPAKPDKGNLPVIKRVKQLMEGMGDYIGVPLTVGIERHERDWATGETVYAD